MSRLLRVLYEYPGVGRAGQVVDESEVKHNPYALVEAGICEWANADRNDAVVVETTDVVPVRETTAANPVKRGPGRPRRGSTGGESAV